VSRIGKRPVVIPDKVKVTVNGKDVLVEGPRGRLSYTLPNVIDIKLDGGKIFLMCSGDTSTNDRFYGTARAVINNMVTGVSQGFTKELDIIGVGYKAEVRGKEILLSLGYSHPVVFHLPDGISATVDKQTHITISGCDKKLVGEVAAALRRLRVPDAYKGKGIRYFGEVIKLKVGKAAVGAGGAAGGS